MAYRFVKNVLLLGIPFGLVMGLFFTWRGGWVLGSICGVGAGVSFGFIMATFAERKRKQLQSSTGLFEGEAVIFEGPANHFLNGEGRGGWLTLTPTRLVFRSHGNNLQNGALILNTELLRSATPTLTIGLIPNGLRVGRVDGGKESFVVNDRKVWARHITEQIKLERRSPCA